MCAVAAGFLAVLEPGGARPDPAKACRIGILSDLSDLIWGELGAAGRLVRAEGLEPPRPCGHKILSLARLPVPPRPHGWSTISKFARLCEARLCGASDYSRASARDSGKGRVSRAAMKKAAARREKAGPMPWRSARAPMMKGAVAEKMRPAL